MPLRRHCICMIERRRIIERWTAVARSVSVPLRRRPYKRRAGSNHAPIRYSQHVGRDPSERAAGVQR